MRRRATRLRGHLAGGLEELLGIRSAHRLLHAVEILDVLRELYASHYPAPILIVSGQNDVPTAVEAIKSGALDFIEKPIEPSRVVARVREAVAAHARSASNGDGGAPRFPGWDKPTPREREVLDEITRGASNKEAGRHLGISPRTVEVHRARIMDKLGAKNAADLVRITLS